MKYVAVTGAYGGIGRAVVETLRDNGFFVFALDVKVEEVENNVMPIQVDVRDSESVNKALEQIKSVTDTLYAIAHFAGVYALDSLVEVPDDKFLRSFDINVFGVFRINKTFMPLLKNGSRILITTSELAPLNPLPFTGIYAITKSTLDKYALSLKMELQLLGIHVSVLRPGAVKTELLNDSTTELDRFCDNTKLYSCNARRFKKIVNGVETKNITPKKVSLKALKAIKKKKPKYVYKINRNPLLILLSVLPVRLQAWILRKILK